MAINLLKNVNIDGKWRMLPVAVRNGKPRWSYVLLDGQEVHHPEGNYHLDYRDADGKRHRPSVGSVPNEVYEARLRKAAELEAIALGVDVRPSTETKDERPGTLLADAAKEHIRNVLARKSANTYRKYSRVISSFVKSCDKEFVEQVDRRDVMSFMNELSEAGDGGRTIENKTIIVLSFLKTFKVSRLLLRQDWPEYIKADKQPYLTEELRKFFAACAPDEFLLFQFFLGTGFRDQEVRYAEYRDIDYEAGIIRVLEKKHWNFKPKGKEIRDVPLTDTLLALLSERAKTAKGKLIFPSPTHSKAPKAHPGGMPNDKFLIACKEIALQAGLNCGDCVNSKGEICAAEPCCHNWTLHKFRHSFGTFHLRDGVDIETVATWMGHKDINTVRDYLKAIKASDARPKLNTGTMATMIKVKMDKKG
jgi:integrase